MINFAIKFYPIYAVIAFVNVGLRLDDPDFNSVSFVLYFKEKFTLKYQMFNFNLTSPTFVMCP